MLKVQSTTKQTGFSLVEVILSSAIFVLLVTTLVGAYLYGQESTALAGNQARATYLAEEGLEAVRNIRDANYTNLVDGTYGLATTTNQWNLTGSTDITGPFTRQITISTIDSDRKSVTSNVVWQQNPQRTGSVTLTSRLTYWQKFVATIGNWANPNTLASSIDLTGNQVGLKVQVQGNYAYLIRNINNGVSFVVIDISNTSSPSVVGSATLLGTPADIAVSGNYAYVASNSDTQEIQIIDISSPTSPTLVGFYAAAGKANGLGVAIVGTTAYLVRQNRGSEEFISLDVSNPTTPTVIGSIGLSNSGNDVAVVGNYAYVATSDTNRQLQVIDISTPSAPVLAGTLKLGGAAATKIAVAGTVAVLGSGSTLYTVNVATPSAPVQLGTFAAGGGVNDISLGNNNNYAFIATSNTASELQVVDITTPASPSLVGIFNATGNYNGVAYDPTSDRAYVATAITTAEFGIVAP